MYMAMVIVFPIALENYSTSIDQHTVTNILNRYLVEFRLFLLVKLIIMDK